MWRSSERVTWTVLLGMLAVALVFLLYAAWALVASMSRF